MKYVTMLLALISIFLSIASKAQDDFQVVFQNLDWSPDGDHIAFTVIRVKPDWSDYSPEKWSLFLYNLKTKDLKQVASSSLYLSFSPDGKRLAFDQRDGKNADIYTYRLSDGNIEKVVAHEDKDGGPSWSGDGKLIVFYSNRSGHEELYTLALATGKIKQLTKRNEFKSYNPSWAPHLDLIAYYLEKGDGKDQIYITDSKGSFHTNLTNGEHHNVFPSWTPDDRIIYTRDEGEVMRMKADGSGKESLCGLIAGQVKMSPDGSTLLLSNENGELETVKLSDCSQSVILTGTQIYN